MKEVSLNIAFRRALEHPGYIWSNDKKMTLMPSNIHYMLYVLMKMTLSQRCWGDELGIGDGENFGRPSSPTSVARGQFSILMLVFSKKKHASVHFFLGVRKFYRRKTNIVTCLERHHLGESTMDWMVRRIMIFPVHQSSSPSLDIGTHIFLNSFQSSQRCTFNGWSRRCL